MRHWGIVITAFYALMVTFLLSYGALFLAEDWEYFSDDFGEHFGVIVEGGWTFVLFMVCGQALLLFLSVDTAWRRMQARRHAMVTAGLVGLMVAILVLSAFFAIGMAHSGDDFELVLESWFDVLPENSALPVAVTLPIVIWAFWAVLFYTFSKRASEVIDNAVGWLLKGSVLELLVAVPCHTVIRQREECCAPFISAYGIATGIAIMLMAFGPSALFLYKRKLADYGQRMAK